MQYEGGATVSFSMVAFTEKLCARQTRIFGTKVRVLKVYFPTVEVVDRGSVTQCPSIVLIVSIILIKAGISSISQ